MDRLTDLSPVSVEQQGFDVVRVSFQFHEFGTGSWVPYSQNLTNISIQNKDNLNLPASERESEHQAFI